MAAHFSASSAMTALRMRELLFAFQPELISGTLCLHHFVMKCHWQSLPPPSSSPLNWKFTSREQCTSPQIKRRSAIVCCTSKFSKCLCAAAALYFVITRFLPIKFIQALPTLGARTGLAKRETTCSQHCCCCFHISLSRVVSVRLAASRCLTQWLTHHHQHFQQQPATLCLFVFSLLHHHLLLLISQY